VKLRLAALLIGLYVAAPAIAGPPYLTDDPEPTDLHHWEIYAFTAGQGHGSDLDDDSGFDLNYGLVKDVQLTSTVPLTFSHDGERGWRAGAGNVEIGAKYRFIHDEAEGVSAAIFPRVILPTSTVERRGKAQLLLPLWLGKNFADGTSLFGGGGYEINPGPGNRNFWQAGAALTHDLTKAFSVGGELAWQSADTIGGSAQTSAGIGAIVHIAGPVSLFVSGGPTWADHRTDYRFYAALGLLF